MKHGVGISILLILTLAITACASSATTSANGGETQTETSEESGDTEAGRPAFADGELPIAIQLQIGTFKVEGTEYAIDSTQARTLLPLWKAYRSLTSSDTAAMAEINAVLDQIQGAMTPAQLEYITSLDFSQESMSSLMEELGVTPGGFGGEDDLPEGFNPREFFPGGGFPGEGLGAGRGPGGFGGEGLTPEQQATMEAMQESRGGPNNRIASFLIEPLIEYLEEIASGE